MPAQSKPPSERSRYNGDRVRVSMIVPIADAEAFEAYVAAKGWSRARVLRSLVRKLSISALTPEALEFRRLQKLLPELEDQ